MSYEEFKKKMDDLGIDCYKYVIHKPNDVPKHCYKCGMLEYENHECKNQEYINEDS